MYEAKNYLIVLICQTGPSAMKNLAVSGFFFLVIHEYFYVNFTISCIPLLYRCSVINIYRISYLENSLAAAILIYTVCM